MSEPHGTHFVRSAEKTLAVLRAFTPEHQELTLSEVVQRTGLDRSGARRFLLTLVDLGYVSHDGRLFTLTPRVLEFGYSYLSGRSLPELARPHLRKLTERLGEMTAVAVLDGDDIRYVLRVPSPKLLSVAIPVGTRFPAHATSMGKVLLAGLPPEQLEARLGAMTLHRLTESTTTSRQALRAELTEIRNQGFVVCDDELEAGLRGVAVPLRDAAGEVHAAVNVSLDARGTTPEAARERIVPPLLTTAERVESDLRLKSGG
ncbi:MULTISPECIES: IclR family transcriptional regulator C-terminal domain-containing protein [unclassified Actinopolyspora]|uniref:IclR family transcriptional regulator domain-containing protein n=1 Tax=Actinopolyspora TaxID=1849 RepID=UPI0013F60A0C|nr:MULTISPECIES: IclR family transcriptional regulator C-terminal domain-containing protein [unclassified Actinopolyspora]NHD17303.1 helix-turn-helix domain-containing protein [Actinopolyspora sp. BKK2]NHE76455.1 helix-turn-helix domain-containing protein [Actinopolyspora sp. BKK1]